MGLQRNKFPVYSLVASSRIGNTRRRCRMIA